MFKAVDALSQQRWLWNGIACGADAVLFWCWRDEIFGKESSGFGLSGNDGLAPERLAAMKVTGRLIEEYDDLISNYRPVKPEVGVMFSPQSYYLYWAQEGNASRSVQALKGYTRCLVRKSIPYLVVEEEHLEVLSELKVLFLPRIIVTGNTTEKALEDFVKKGGTLVCESECGAFNPQGFYRYPGERFIARLSGIHEVGRRSPTNDWFTARIDGQELNLGITQWLTPHQKGKGQVLANGEEGALMVEVPVGKGKLVLCGAYLGDAYLHNWTADFENFVELMVRRAGWQPEIELLSPRPTKDSFLYIKSGQSGEKRVVFIFFPPDYDKVHLRFKANFFSGMHAMDIISGKEVNFLEGRSGQECTLTAPEWRFSVLVGH
jgi:beta-galactosidase